VSPLIILIALCSADGNLYSTHEHAHVNELKAIFSQYFNLLTQVIDAKVQSANQVWHRIHSHGEDTNTSSLETEVVTALTQNEDCIQMSAASLLMLIPELTNMSIPL
jgi:hypothetical protein